MAKSSRASSTKANNQRLKRNVFGPIEAARQKRLSARLLEIASQPKPVPEKKMEDATEPIEAEKTKTVGEGQAADAMEIDLTAKPTKSKKTVDKRRGKKSNIAFRKYGDKKTIRKRK